MTPSEILYPEPNVKFGDTKSSIIAKFGSSFKEDESNNSIVYSDYSFSAPILLFGFDESDKLKSYIILVKSSSKIMEFLSKQYKFFKKVNDSFLFIDGTIDTATKIVGLSVYSDSFYQVLYGPAPLNQRNRPESTARSAEWKGNGTGFFIDKRGYIATNYHVIEDAKEIEIEFIRSGERLNCKAQVVQSDRQNDLTILKVSDNNFIHFQNIPYNFYTGIKDVGTNIFALGYPIALVMGSEVKFTDGKISSKTGIQGDVRVYQISVPIQPGNSGGPLFDYDGNLVGITSSGLNRKYFNSENVNYAIKLSYLNSLIEVLPTSLNLPSDKSIYNSTLTEKIKILSDYVVLIKVR